MESISIFDMLKIGVGPSSSHTLGPWRAAIWWLEEIESKGGAASLEHVEVHLYGSLSLTGVGHATDIAVVLGLCGFDPITYPTDQIDNHIATVKHDKTLMVNSLKSIPFDFQKDIHFHKTFLDFHPNGMTIKGTFEDGSVYEENYYSIGGGFVVKEQEQEAVEGVSKTSVFPFPIEKGTELLAYCKEENKIVSEIVLENELSIRSPEEIDSEIQAIWNVMLESIYEGCHTKGLLPGGLNVKRRAYKIHKSLIGDATYSNPEEWIESIRNTKVAFRQILQWVSCFAIAVNEVNADLGRVVTAPTNGSAGVIPSVLLYYLCIENHDAGFEEIKQFLLVAGEVGALFKKGATISAALGGCQAEIGVSSAMAAGALAELMGATPEQVLIASEIAMEHHLGLTCDPIAGLVQVPCIERNTMGAIKAINAAEIALHTNPKHVKVPFDAVVNTMWETAKDMNTKYKETSEGGLAVSVNLSDC